MGEGERGGGRQEGSRAETVWGREKVTERGKVQESKGVKVERVGTERMADDSEKGKDTR